MIKIAFIFGTRPEAIKMAPIINLAKKDKAIKPLIISSGQHKEMLDQTLSIFKIKPDFDLKIMKRNQTLSEITSRIIKKIDPLLNEKKPDLVLVQGDTSTAFVGALASFYNQIPVGHIEAGLRSFDKKNPFPEEINRKIISSIADIHFAPTIASKNNLINEGIKKSEIFKVGNTVIDALKIITKQVSKFSRKEINQLDLSGKIILVTTHRRENLGKPIKNIVNAINQLTNINNDIKIILPMHPNPKIRETLVEGLSKNRQVYLTEPLDYTDFVLLMNKSYLIITDSGGVQEEAPTLGTPVLVTRETTERSEGVKAGTAIMVGTEKEKIVNTAKKLLNNKENYQKMARKKNPYGDGKTSSRIIKIIKMRYGKR